MAGIEGISGAGMVYQGSVSTAEVKVEAQPKQNDSANIEGSAQLAADTISLDTKQTSGDGAGSGAEGQAAGQQAYAKNAQIKKAVEEINKNMINTSEAIFGIHEETNRVTIKIVDKNTKEVVKEYPPEKTLDMIAKVWEMAGLMVDERR
ncbi:MAG: flagellar protein FlaG [Lachnospiraceae bacterium]